MFLREMLDRALVKRLRDSDSETEEESSSSQSKKPSSDKPTDVLTADKPTEAPVRVTTHMQQSVCPVLCLGTDWVQMTFASICFPATPTQLFVSAATKIVSATNTLCLQ